MSDRPLVAIYADESCLGNGREGDNPGGAGGLVEWKNPRTGELVTRDYWISEPATTNNRMAIRSAIEALRAISAKGTSFDVVFTSDSQYLVKGGREWLRGWIARGFKRTEGPVLNRELWEALAIEIGKHRIDWRWVRGHNAHPQNEYANELATRAAADQSASGGLVESGFLTWLEQERAGNRMKGDPDPFPDHASFRPAAPLPPTAGMRQG